jgi:hypothetical protein
MATTPFQPSRGRIALLSTATDRRSAKIRCDYCLSLLKSPQRKERLEIFAGRHTVTVMVTILCALVSIFEFRVRSRVCLELELIAL